MDKRRDMKIMWNSNAPWSTSGYGVQTYDLLYRFIKDGWKTACICFYGLEGGIIDVNGLICYPKMGETWGTDACIYHANDFGADVCFTFQDIWVMDQNLLGRIKNWIPYVPIDHEPVPRPVLERLRIAHRVVTLSRFGQKVLQKEGIESKLILEGVDTNIFQPMDKKEMRKAFGIPEDIYLFGMVAANKDNPPRKSFQQCMDAFVEFNKKHPKSGMFFHTLTEQQGGFPITQYAHHLGIADKIWFPPPYHVMFKSPHPLVAKVMNTFDCLLNPSTNEGFGLPIIEAQSCGVPVIVNNTTSMPELVIPGKTGFVADTCLKRWTPITGYIAYPDTNSILQKMEEVFNADAEKMKKDCRQHMLENYDIDNRVKNEWIPFLEEIQESLVKK
jgi:glycosyltransferase involved in cell wall biosynthesis